MKKWVFELVIHEGNDEFWEYLNNLSVNEQELEIKSDIQCIFEDSGYLDTKIKLKKFEQDFSRTRYDK